jgi:hypothetical protein
VSVTPAGSGGSGVGGNGGIGGNTTAPFSPAAGAFRRLTTSEFRNSVTDLLGPVTIGEIEPDSWSAGFATVGASEVSLSATGVEKYQNVIDAMTTEVFANTARRDQLVGCVPANAQDSACFRSYITRFGRLAWRRTLTTAQIDRYVQLAGSLSTTLGDVWQGVRQTTNALLGSPYFLYRAERGKPTPADAKVWAYSSFEMASRLSYFLTNTAPDALLLGAAERDALATAAGVQAEAERLLAGAPGRRSIGTFATELYRLEVVAARAKDATRFPQYTPALKDAIVREVPAALQALLLDDNASAMSMFTNRSTFVNLELARLYGLPTAGLTTTSWTRVSLPADGPRAGILGSAAFLGLNATQLEGSPTNRGKFLREQVFCQTIPDPPPDVSTNLPDPPAGVILTKREKLAAHEVKPTCAACHSLMDPLGLPMENFDAIGQYRATDQGKTIDVSGDVDGVKFVGPAALGDLLSKNEEVMSCMVRNVYRFATGRHESPGEERVIADLGAKFKTSGNKMRGLMLDIVTSDGFRLVAPGM